MASTGGSQRGRSAFSRAGLVVAIVVAALVAATWAVLSQPQFGATMTGARLQRALANPQYRDGRFTNLEPETPTSMAALGDYIVRQFSGHEVREPPAPLPVLPHSENRRASPDRPIPREPRYRKHSRPQEL